MAHPLPTYLPFDLRLQASWACRLATTVAPGHGRPMENSASSGRTPRPSDAQPVRTSAPATASGAVTVATLCRSPPASGCRGPGTSPLSEAGQLCGGQSAPRGAIELDESVVDPSHGIGPSAARADLPGHPITHRFPHHHDQRSPAVGRAPAHFSSRGPCQPASPPGWRAGVTPAWSA